MPALPDVPTFAEGGLPGVNVNNWVGAFMAALGGAWFVVGPAVSLTWESGTGPIGRPLFGSARQMLELVGYFYGLGALIVAFAAYSLGRVSSLSAVAAREPAGVTAARPAEPTAQEPPAAGPASTSRRRRGAVHPDRCCGQPRQLRRTAIQPQG